MFAGIYFYLVNTDTIESISVFIDPVSDTATIIAGQLYEMLGSTLIQKISTEEYIIQAADIGNWITIPLLIISPGTEVLEGEHEYLAGFELYPLGMNLYIGTDTVAPHNYEIETSFRDSFGNPVDEVPMIEVNMTPPSVIAIESPENSHGNLFKLFPNPV